MWKANIDFKSQPLVSVVTPVYNGEQFLAECIESVLAQTYQNWEYVIVNNCSSDRSAEIAQQYAQRDARIRVCHNETFLNQLQNCNQAFRQISPESKYCKVVHADDWLFPDCISRMVEVAEANPSVGIVGSYRLEENRVDLDGLPYPSPVVSGREICRLTLLADLYVFGSPTSLLIRSDFIRSRVAFYDESIIQADKKACFEILQHADFGFVHQVLTFTRRHNESMTSLIHRFNTRQLGKLIYLVQFGPVFLTEAEYRLRLQQVLANYYRFLARSAFEFREREFWNYHRAELKKLGYPLSWTRLAKAVLLSLLNLRDVASRARLALKRKRSQDTPQSVKSWDMVFNALYTTKPRD